ncbi:hypothetical protein [Saccharopolyspora shandongensis]|uniref:hypothetical protein n=1 Tax=Saccharopolyspora shandongensis TaxID=418495 RepID=UPI0033E3DEB8
MIELNANETSLVNAAEVGEKLTLPADMLPPEEPPATDHFTAIQLPVFPRLVLPGNPRKPEYDVELRTIRGSIIRKILCDTSNLSPRGIRLSGAVVAGPLDLSDLQVTVPLILTSCRFQGTIALKRASFPHISLMESIADDIDAKYLTIEHDLNLFGLECSGGLDLTDTHIKGSVNLRRARLAGDYRPALEADRIQVDGTVVATDLRANSKTNETIRLVGANIAGQLNLKSAEITNASGVALVADGLQARDVYLNDGFSARGVGELGAVRLSGANITGHANLSDATISNPSGPALDGQRLRADHDFVLCDNFSAEGGGALGAIRLAGAHIAGQLNMQSATISNRNGPALAADQIHVEGSIACVTEFQAKGEVCLTGAHIGGQLQFSGASVSEPNGNAINADGIRVDGGAFLDDGFIAEGSLRFIGARITGQLAFRNAALNNPKGTALALHGMQVHGDVFLDEGFHAQGAGNTGVVLLHRAQIHGLLSFKNAIIRTDDKDCLHLGLSRTHIGASLTLPISHLRTNSGTRFRVDLDGLTYSGIPRGASTKEWINLLRECTVAYVAQPYQQIASAHRAAGHEHDARRVFVAQQNDLRRRGDLGGPFRRLVHWASGVLIGYGFHSWRALGGLLASVFLSIVLTYSASASGVTIHTQNARPTSCKPIEVLGLAIDQAVPLVKTGSKQLCQIDTNKSVGQFYFAASWSTQLLGWAFATLFVAGFTGIVRKK